MRPQREQLTILTSYQGVVDLGRDTRFGFSAARKERLYIDNRNKRRSHHPVSLTRRRPKRSGSRHTVTK
jgi:hypothetical protein